MSFLLKGSVTPLIFKADYVDGYLHSKMVWVRTVADEWRAPLAPCTPGLYMLLAIWRLESQVEDTKRVTILKGYEIFCVKILFISPGQVRPI